MDKRRISMLSKSNYLLYFCMVLIQIKHGTIHHIQSYRLLQESCLSHRLFTIRDYITNYTFTTRKQNIPLM